MFGADGIDDCPEVVVGFVGTSRLIVSAGIPGNDKPLTEHFIEESMAREENEELIGVAELLLGIFPKLGNNALPSWIVQDLGFEAVVILELRADRLSVGNGV